MESVLLLKPDFFTSLYEQGIHGWMAMAASLGLMYHFVLIVVGLLVCYYGFRIYRIVVVTFGALAGALGGLLLIEYLNLSGAGTGIDPVLAGATYGVWDYVGLIAGGILGGLLFWWLSWVAVFVLGFAGCAFIGFFAVSSIAPGPAAIFVAVALGVIGGILAVWLFKPFIIVLTAILGAFDFAMGVAGILVATGVITVLTADANAGMWAFIFPFVLMIILGIVNQVLDNYRKEFKTEKPEEVPTNNGPKEEPAAAT